MIAKIKAGHLKGRNRFSDGLPYSVIQPFSAAMFELFARTANAGRFHGRQRYGRVDEIPTAVCQYEGRPFVVRFPLTACAREIGGELHQRMMFSGMWIMAQHIQTQPLGLCRPLRQGCRVQQRLLRGDGGVDDIVNVLQNEGRITRPHQFFRIGSGRTLMQRAAAFGVGSA